MPSDEYTVVRSLKTFTQAHKDAGTTPSEWDMISLLVGYVVELEEKLVHIQRRLIELHGDY